ncbi:UNVERIFIED_CONTAM: hypothetical protein K2H54_020491 [Gekko kuhli]
MAARWGRLRGAALRALPKELETEEEAAARLEEERRAKAVRLRRVQRLMEPPGPPERTLSRQAMEQMRHLRRDSPEEWSLSRLARSFDVSPDVVARVLRSRFSPSPERALKQDSRLPTPLGSGGGGSSAPEPTGQLLLPPPSRAGARALAPGPEVAPRKKGARRDASPPASSRPQGRRAEPADQDQEAPPLRVVRKGRDVVDGDGNFLYRIPA